MACEYKFRDEHGIDRTLNEEEFSAYLYDLIKKRGLGEHFESILLSAFDDSKAKADNIRLLFSSKHRSKSSLDPDEDPDKIHNWDGHIGTTDFITSHGNPKTGIENPIITPFNEKQWEANKRSELHKAGLNDDTIDEIISNIKDSWKQLQEYGDTVHAIYEAVFKNSTVPANNGLPDSVYNNIIDSAKAFKDELTKKYGGRTGNVQFYPELTIASKELDPDLKKLLAEKTDPIHAIGGIIDLLVIDSEGKPHIFDYKTSRKKLVWQTNNAAIGPDEWSSTKQLSVQNQLAAYNCILQQYGFDNADCWVVPIYLDLEYTDTYKQKIANVNSITQQEAVIAPKTSSGNIYGNWKTLVPIKISTDAEETIEISNKFKSLFPLDHIGSNNVQQFEASVEYYKERRVKDVPASDKEHFGTYKYYFVKYETNGRKEYAKTLEELNEKLNKFVEEVKYKKANELYSLASVLRKSLAGEISLKDFSQDYRLQHQNFVETMFGRYINDGWTLASDDNLVGMGLFLFKKSGKSELVVVSNNPLHDKINLGLGSYITGRYIEDMYVDSKTTLPATNGNIAGMKAMIYISEHPELFTEDKLTQLVVINPWTGQKTDVHNSDWVKNYNDLVSKAGDDSGLKTVSQELFYDDVVSLLSIVDSYLQSIGESAVLNGFSISGIDGDGNLLEYTEEYVTKAIAKLKSDHAFLNNPENAFGGDQSVWLAYNYLYETLLALRGLRTYNELEPGSWLSSGIKSGLLVSSAGYSPSTNFRVFDDVMQQFALEVRLAVEKQGRPVIATFNKFYREKAQAKIIGGEAKLFLRWFNRDEQGNIDKSFTLKDPSDPDFQGAEKEALDTFLRTMAELRWRTDNMTDEQFETIVQQKKDEGLYGSYYQVPLTEAAFSRQVKGLGLKSALKNKWEEARELTMDVFAGKTKEKEQWKKDHPFELYNKFKQTSEARAKLIEDHGVGFFETNLEDVINQALVYYNKSRLSRKFIPIIDGMRVTMRCNLAYGGTQAKDTLANFDKLVKAKFYGESIVDAELQPYMRWVQTVKSFFSKLQLGFNFRSFFRELFQGTWMGMSRSGIQMLPGVDLKTYVDGALHVVTKAHKNFSNVSLLQQLNSQYGMANYSMAQISKQRRLNWYGIKNFRTDTMFMTSSAPDFQHRMAILVAKMMGDGCWEAHSLDEDGFIKYDFSKDQRFAVYLSGDTSNKLYLDQKTNYLERIAELNRAGITKEDGSTYKEGDALPMAYLPKEIQAIRNFADLLYGHYDDETKSLMNDMLLGSMFLQYKTYVTSRFEQWAMTPGVYNTELLQYDKDPVTGEQLYKVHNDLNEDGSPNIEVLTRSQIESSGRSFDQLVSENRIEAAMSWKGIPMEGMGRSYIGFLKDACTWNWADFKKRWQNPVERDNILIGLHDCALMSLIMMLITALFGVMLKGELTTDREAVYREAQKNGWGSSFAYNVAYGSFQDFPFWQTFSSMFGDLNPMVVTSAKRFVTTSANVITGKKSVAQAVTNTIGATADLRGWANKLAEASENI